MLVAAVTREVPVLSLRVARGHVNELRCDTCKPHAFSLTPKVTLAPLFRQVLVTQNLKPGELSVGHWRRVRTLSGAL